MKSIDDSNIPPPTIPEVFNIALRGFSNEHTARQLGDCVGVVLRETSRFIDLSRLDGVTIAYDYDLALSEIDRGFIPCAAPKRTYTDDVIGVAMCLPVLRDATVRAHLVVHADAASPLLIESSEDYELVINLLAHECAHVADLKRLDDLFPRVRLSPHQMTAEAEILEPYSSRIWAEYAACRIAAPLGGKLLCKYEECLVRVLSHAREEANREITEYRNHGNAALVLNNAGRLICEPLIMAAYVLGHIDGLNRGWDCAPTARDAIMSSPYLPLIERMASILRDHWCHRACWSHWMLHPLHELVKITLEDGGLSLATLESGELFVDLPFRPETMP